MRVALVHDWLLAMRGGERVLERLAGLFPNADIHTLLHARGTASKALESRTIRATFVSRIPGAHRHHRWWLPLFPHLIERIDLSAYDVVVSSSHCVAKGVLVRPGALHVSYVYTPMRYAWDFEKIYFPEGRYPWPVTRVIRRECARLRAWDARTASRPFSIIACSRATAGRIARHWRREAEVVHPPVDLARFTPRRARGDYLLVAGALVPYKRSELAIEACRRLGCRLVVAGGGSDERAMRRLAGRDVEFRGSVSDGEMAELLAGARALLFPGEEDFGILPVEAMASGCPVVAFGRGGALETVARGTRESTSEELARDGVASVPGGVLFRDQTVDGVIAGIQRMAATNFDPIQVCSQAEPFAAERFDREFMAAFERARSAHASAST